MVSINKKNEDYKMNTKKLWNKDFTMVVIGQIISLFGNAILRFALPLYLLNQTGSAALFGLVSACAFIPMIILVPIGGIFADRVNKRNIMVILDFFTAALTLLFTLLLGQINLVGLLLVTLIILYGIQGAYQPSVQASIPVLLNAENIMQGNAIINLVSSFAGLIGPVIGGALFGFFDIKPILYVSFFCFLASAIMEIFIHIPFQKKKTEGNIFAIGFGDIKESFKYMCYEQPAILKVSFIIAAINLFLSALIIIGLPVLVTQRLSFSVEKANSLYGYAQGALAAGSLMGGMLAGAFSKKLKAQNSYKSLFYCALTLIPIGVSIAFPMSQMTSYIIIVISCFFMMALASMFSIQMMSYLQMVVPTNIMGKVISCAICIGMCASPLGQAIYGGLFEVFTEKMHIIFFTSAILTCLVAIISKGLFAELDSILNKLKTNRN